MSDFNKKFTKEKGECSFVHFLIASVLFCIALILGAVDFSFLGKITDFAGGSEPFKYYLRGILYLISFLLAGRNVVISAVHSFFNKEENPLNEMLLFTLSSVAAILIEQFSLAVEIMLFFQFGRILERTVFFCEKEIDSKIKSVLILIVLIVSLCLALIPNLLISFGILNQKEILGKSAWFFWAVVLLSASSFLFVIINSIFKMLNKGKGE